jgi:hypothetical protein
MIVKWSAVKTVNIDEVVDEAFLKKIKSWSYSRIPVIGKPSKEISERSSKQSDWEGTRIYGFLHIKVRSSPRFCYTLFNCSQLSQNLIGVDIKAKQGLGTSLFVKRSTTVPPSNHQGRYARLWIIEHISVGNVKVSQQAIPSAFILTDPHFFQNGYCYPAHHASECPGCH